MGVTSAAYVRLDYPSKMQPPLLYPAPEFINQSVAEHYNRLLGQIDESCAYQTANTLSVLDVLHAHYLIADFFVSEGQGIAQVGPRDMNLVHSAVYRQHVGIGTR